MSKKDDIKRLWRDCFGDSPEYLDMYFNRIYRDADALTIEADGRVASSLLLQRYDLLFHGLTPSMGYIAGAVTRRSQRGRGYMTSLMLEALDISARRGDMICALIPAHDWLYFFFDRFGFSTVFLTDTQRFTSLHPFTTEGDYHPVADAYAPEVYAAFHGMEMARGAGVLHSQRDFLNILDDLALRPGGTFVAVGRDDVPVAAMAWAVDCGDMVQVNDVLGIDDDAHTAALHQIREAFPNRPVRYLAPAADGIRRHLYSRGMGRIVNARLCLELIASTHPRLNTRVRVTDPLLAHNNIDVRLAGGNCADATGEHGNPDFDVTIDVLTRIVFSSEQTGRLLNFPSARTHISLMPH